MLPDRVSNPGPLTYESGALPIAHRGPVNSVFDTNNICSAVFTLAINRLHSFKRQPFWFHNLNSMVPVKGIVFFNLVFFF